MNVLSALLGALTRYAIRMAIMTISKCQSRGRPAEGVLDGAVQIFIHGRTEIVEGVALFKQRALQDCGTPGKHMKRLGSVATLPPADSSTGTSRLFIPSGFFFWIG